MNNYPYCVTSKISGAGLFPLKDGRLQIMKPGDLALIEDILGCIIIEDKLADFLFSLKIEGIALKDVVIWERSSDTEFHNYKQLLIEKKITPENIKSLTVKGLQMYVYNESYIFVSSELKEILEKSEFDYLEFKEGFSWIC